MGRTNKKIIKNHLSLSGSSLIELIKIVHGKKNEFRFRATGNSMKPAIHDGDVITISPIGNFLPGPGEIAAYIYQDGQELIVHRIVSLIGGNYSIRGDNASYTHHEVPVEDIIGIVTKVEKDGKIVSRYGRYHASILIRIGLKTFLIKMKLIRLFKKVISNMLK